MKEVKEEEVVADKKSLLVKFVRYNVDTKMIRDTLFNMGNLVKRLMYLMDDTKEISNVDAYQIYEKQIRIFNDLNDLNDFMRVMVSKMRHNNDKSNEYDE